VTLEEEQASHHTFRSSPGPLQLMDMEVVPENEPFLSTDTKK